MPDSPTLSVVLVNYNHGNLLRRSLPALFAQTRPADEWILIDDASTDDSREIMAAIARGQPHVTLVHHETNQGVIATINEGLRRARGDYIYFAAADDVALPDLFARLLQAAASHPGVGLCLSDFFEFSDEGGPLRRRHVSLHNITTYLDGHGFGRLLLSGARFYYPPCGALVRRDSLKGTGAYDARGEWFIDWWFNLQAGLKDGVCFVPEALAGFRVNPSGYGGASSRQPGDLPRVVGQLWSLALPDGEPRARENLWFCALAAMPPETRQWMWREIWRRPGCWTWGLRHIWQLVLWPALRPWLWPMAQLASRIFPGIYPAALRLFGAHIEPGARLEPGVTVDRPWRLRLDSGAVLRSGVKISAKESIRLGPAGQSEIAESSRLVLEQILAQGQVPTSAGLAEKHY